MLLSLILNSSTIVTRNSILIKVLFSVENHPDGQDQEMPQDGAHVTLHQGTRPSPISEAHAVVRPIVNIIVPNNRADLLSEGG